MRFCLHVHINEDSSFAPKVGLVPAVFRRWSAGLRLIVSNRGEASVYFECPPPEEGEGPALRLIPELVTELGALPISPRAREFATRAGLSIASGWRRAA